MPKNRDKLIDQAVTIFLYNRPNLLKELLKRMDVFRFRKVYLVCDGPKPNDFSDYLLVEECRQMAESKLRAEEIVTHYQKSNVGIARNITNGINQVFENEKFAIFLEDDTLPHPTFFQYCETLGKYYAEEAKIFSIAGFNRFSPALRIKAKDSYFFSSYPSFWGWASWANKWQKTSNFSHRSWLDIRDLPEFRELFLTRRESIYWKSKLDYVFIHNNTWDTQLLLLHKLGGQLSVIPKQNLISNVGMGRPDSTNTKTRTGLADVPQEEMEFPLAHPKFIKENKLYEKKFSNYVAPSIQKRGRLKIKRIIANLHNMNS